MVLDELKKLRNDHAELKKLVDKLSKTVMTLESQFSKSTNDEGKDEEKQVSDILLEIIFYYRLHLNKIMETIHRNFFLSKEKRRRGRRR